MLYFIAGETEAQGEEVVGSPSAFLGAQRGQCAAWARAAELHHLQEALYNSPQAGFQENLLLIQI